MAKYLVWRPDYGSTEEDARKVEAYDHESAAETWAKSYDADGDYTIVSGGEAEVLVKEAGTDETPKKFNVTGEAEPVYYAREIE